MTPQRKDLVRMLAIGVVAAVLGTWGALSIDWFPAQASTAAPKIDTLYDWLLVASVPMFVLVMAVAIYCVVRFRVRPGGPTGDGAPIHGNTRLEVVWVTIPFVIVTALAIYAAVVLAQIEKKQPNELQVRAIAQQFTWHFEYTAPNGKKFQTNELYVPKDRGVYMAVDSLDVLHDFWVPEFRVKIDAVPGQTDHIRFTPTRVGDYQVICAELCGLGHATMRVAAHVMTQDKFNAWFQSQLKKGGAVAGATPAPGSNPGGGATSGAGGTEPDSSAGKSGGTPASGETTSAAQGKAIFTGEGGCGACHTLADAGTSGAVGPKLNGVAAKGRAYIEESIVSPDKKVAAGFQKGIMPGDFETRLGRMKIDALVKYLLQAGK